MGGLCHPLLHQEDILMNFIKKWKPVFIENSNVPVWLSKIAPLEIYAICLGPIVFARGPVNAKLRRHETIHWQQMIELLINQRVTRHITVPVLNKKHMIMMIIPII